MKILVTIIYFLLSVSLHQLNAQNHPEWNKLRPLINSTKDFYDQSDSDYGLDPDYETEGEFPFALEDLKYGHRLLLRDSPNDSCKNKLKAVKGKYHEAKFDEHGNKIFEKYDSWMSGSSFKYEYASNGKPVSISMIDEDGYVLGKAKYKYDSLGKLLQVGELLLKYYGNGLLKSVEDRSEIEIYMYDSGTKLVHVYFDLKPGFLACGNRTTEWKGEYNSKGQLVFEYLFGFPEITKYHKYSKDGLLINTSAKDDLFSKTMTKYFYEKGKLTSTKTYDSAGVVIDTEQYIY
jgi:hypothetical protein